MRYLTWVPKKAAPVGRVVVHNHVVSVAGRRSRLLGVDGFRAWTQRPEPALLEVCSCAWAPAAGRHYRVKPVLLESAVRRGTTGAQSGRRPAGKAQTA